MSDLCKTVPGVIRYGFTGSQVYGTPTEKSDVDIVVQVEPGDWRRYWKDMDSSTGDEYGAYDSTGLLDATFRLGRFNFLIVTADAQFEVWKRGTEELTIRAPVTREQAIEVFQRLKRELL